MDILSGVWSWELGFCFSLPLFFKVNEGPLQWTGRCNLQFEYHWLRKTFLKPTMLFIWKSYQLAEKNKHSELFLFSLYGQISLLRWTAKMDNRRGRFSCLYCNVITFSITFKLIMIHLLTWWSINTVSCSLLSEITGLWYITIFSIIYLAIAHFILFINSAYLSKEDKLAIFNSWLTLVINR